jgi:hypothetical protein
MTQITVGDININYGIQGSGVPLLMIMGLSFSLRDWGEKFTELLSKLFTLVFPKSKQDPRLLREVGDLIPHYSFIEIPDPTKPINPQSA